MIQRNSSQNQSSSNSTPSPIPGQINLEQFISKNQIEVLNADPKTPASTILVADSACLKSDCDEQLIICNYFKFMNKIIAPNDGPKTVKTYINRTSALSFDEDSPSVETLTFSGDDLLAETAPTALKFVKYQSVVHLTLFVVDGHGKDDITQIQQILLYGSPIEGFKIINIDSNQAVKHD